MPPLPGGDGMLCPMRLPLAELASKTLTELLP